MRFVAIRSLQVLAVGGRRLGLLGRHIIGELPCCPLRFKAKETDKRDVRIRDREIIASSEGNIYGTSEQELAVREQTKTAHQQNYSHTRHDKPDSSLWCKL